MEEDSQENVDTPSMRSNDGAIGEVRLLLFEDETMRVEFAKLGRWTPGRLEKAMPLLFRECILARQAFERKSRGLPEHVNTEQSDG